MKEGTRLDALAVAYCLAAAASGTVAGSLTVLGAGCLSLLLIGTVLKLWGRHPSPLRSACALLPAAALAAAIPRLVALARPDWLPAGSGGAADGGITLLGACLLMTGPAAERMADGEFPSLRKFVAACVALSAVGAVRELAGAGTLWGIRVLPSSLPLSPSFQSGAAGLIVAGLMLALFRVRFPSLGRMRLYDGLWAGAAAVLLFWLTGGSFALLVQWIPLPEGWSAVGAGFLAGLTLLAWGYVFPAGPLRSWLREPTLGALAAGALWGMEGFLRDSGFWSATGGLLLAAAVLFAALAVAGALLERVDHFALPRFARLAPVTLVSSGLVLLAFQALRQML